MGVDELDEKPPERAWKDYITFHADREFPPTVIRMMATIGDVLEEVYGKGETLVMTVPRGGIVLRVRETDDEAHNRVETTLRNAQQNMRWREEQAAKEAEKTLRLAVKAEELGVSIEDLQEVMT